MLLDSWIWIEIFKRTPKSSLLVERIRNEKRYTSTLSLAEVAFWCTQNGLNPHQYTENIQKNATVLHVNEPVAIEAGKRLAVLRPQIRGIGMVDAIIYTQAQSANMPVLTGDPHFRNLPGVQFIG